MGYEIDFFPVVAGGGAASARWGVPGQQEVLIYDAGTRTSGERLVRHVKERYQTTRVDYLVSSHPGPNHIEGLAVVLQRLDVGEVWLHRPWTHSMRDARRPHLGRGLEQLAHAQSIPVNEPFEGAVIGPFTVLSPNRRWYLDALLPAFGRAVGPSRSETGTWRDLWQRLRRARGWPGRLWKAETLALRSTTIAEAESSAVLYAEFEGRGVLLTGNAGIDALTAACDCAERLGINLRSSLRLMQLPNEGSADHLSSQLLDRLFGSRLPSDQRTYTRSAVVSASRDTPPSSYAMVTSALKRRGVTTFATHGTQLHHSYDMPERDWRPARPMDPQI